MFEIESIVKITVGILTIGSSIIALTNWLIKKVSEKKIPNRVYEKEGNIFGVFKDGEIKQFTHLSRDKFPLLAKVKFKIIFFRSEKVHATREYTRYKLMSIDIKSFEEKVVSDQKPYSDGLDGTFEILQPNSPTLSEDQSKLLFIIEKYATGSQLVQVDIITGKWTELFSVEKFDTIKSGKYKGKLLVGVSEIRDRGRDIYYKVCSLKGETLLDFDNYEDYMRFRSGALIAEK